MAEIIPISKVAPTERCPKCSSPWITRHTHPQDSTVAMNGSALWAIAEECMMTECDWFRVVENVKLGA